MKIVELPCTCRIMCCEDEEGTCFSLYACERGTEFKQIDFDLLNEEAADYANIHEVCDVRSCDRPHVSEEELKSGKGGMLDEIANCEVTDIFEDIYDYIEKGKRFEQIKDWFLD
jgi:hypothetical protein